MRSLSPTVFAKLAPVVRLRSALLHGTTYLRGDARIVFVCGARSTPEWTSGRETILTYVDRHLPQFRFFRAEEVFAALGSAATMDLLSIEDELGKFSDCIVVVCESASAFAELGAFALSDRLVEQLLVINDIKFRKKESFITLGPIKKSDRISLFRPAIYADFEAILLSGPEISSRLNKIPHSRRRRETLHGIPFEQIPPKLRLLFIAEVITLLSPITLAELVEFFKCVSGSNSIPLSTELALGESLGLFSRHKRSTGKDLYHHSFEESVHFFDFSLLNRVSLRAEIVRIYNQRDRSRLEAMRDAVTNHV